MAEFTPTLTSDHMAMISRQSVFFVATAAAEGRINLSPKGYDAFRVLAPDRVAWLDLGGSGNETNAHLLADGRITIMMCWCGRPSDQGSTCGVVMPEDLIGGSDENHHADWHGYRQERFSVAWRR